MRKGASTVIVMVLVMLITISLILMSYQWLLKNAPETQQELEKNLPKKEGCLEIESIDTSNKKITLRNCGDVDLSNFLVYVDDKPVANYSQKLVAGSIIQIDYVEDIEFGEHDVQVSSDYAETPYIRFNYKKPLPSCEWPSNGDWFVDKEILCEDKIITLNGNLNVSNTGNLTFKDVTLKINGTFDDQYNIYVNGGKFYILDKDNNPSTVNDRSIITNGSANKRYNITVYPNSVFQIKNSKVYRTDKINIYASNSIVSGNYINDSNKIYFNSSSQLLDNNYIENHGGINFGYPDNVVITNNIIIKMINSLSGEGGITFTGPSGSQFSNVTIANNIINETYCTGVYFSVDFNNLTFYNNTVKNSIEDIGDYVDCSALYGAYLYNVNISNNFISNYTDSMNFVYFENASITNNFFGNNFRGGSKDYPDGIQINWAVNVEIRNNTITNIAQRGIGIGTVNNLTIINNTISECAYAALLINGNNTKILNNTIKYNRWQPECDSYSHSQCCFASPCGYGIYLASTDNINLTIKYNDIINNYASGIYATGVANEGNILISDNKIINNTDYGIIISTTEPVSGEISRNDIKNNTVGAEFDNFYNVWFNDNVVKFNTNNGVYCYNSGPLFKNNSIINNGDDTDACFMSIPPSTWWNYGWLFRRNVSIDEKIGISRINDPIILNSTEYVMLDANCDNKAYNTTIRVIYNETTEIPFSMYNVSYCPTTGFVKGLKLAFKVNVSQNALGDKSYKIYYTNNTSISKSSFLLKQKPIMILWQQNGYTNCLTGHSCPPNSTAIKTELTNAGYGDIFNDSNTAGFVSVLAYPGFINYTTIMYFQGSKMTYSGGYTYFNTTAMRLREYQRRGSNIFIEGDDTGYDWCYSVKGTSYECTPNPVDGSTFNGTFRNLTHADNTFIDPGSLSPKVVNVTLLYNHPTTKYIGPVGTKFNSTAPYLDIWFSNVGLNSYSIMNSDLNVSNPFIGFSYFGQNDTSCDAYSGYQCKYAVYYSGTFIDTNVTNLGITDSTVRKNFLKGIIGWFYGEDTLNISTDPEEFWLWARP